MSFSVQAIHDDHTLTVTTETAKEAFAKAVEWHVVERGLTHVSISDGNRCYLFSSAMALPGDSTYGRGWRRAGVEGE
jgi:hypothetical protein